MTRVEWFSLGIFFIIGLIAVFAIVIGFFPLFGFISTSEANTVLTAFLVVVTAVYTLATYGDWWSK
jgi:hypothetical protein